MRRPVNPWSLDAPCLLLLRVPNVRLVMQNARQLVEGVLRQRLRESVSDVPVRPDVDELDRSIQAAVSHEVEAPANVLAPLTMASLLGHLDCRLVVVVQDRDGLRDAGTFQEASDVDDLRACGRGLHVLRLR